MLKSLKKAIKQAFPHKIAQEERDELINAFRRHDDAPSIISRIADLSSPDYSTLDTLARYQDPPYSPEEISAIIVAMCSKVSDHDDKFKVGFVFHNFCKPLLKYILDYRIDTSLRTHLLHTNMNFDTELFSDKKYGNIYRKIFEYCINNCQDKEVLFPVLDYINKKAGKVFNRKHAKDTANKGNIAAFEWVLEFGNDTDWFKRDVLNHQINMLYENKVLNDENIKDFKAGVEPVNRKILAQAYELFDFMDLCGIEVNDDSLYTLMYVDRSRKKVSTYLQELHKELHNFTPERFDFKRTLYTAKQLHS